MHNDSLGINVCAIGSMKSNLTPIDGNTKDLSGYGPFHLLGKRKTISDSYSLLERFKGLLITSNFESPALRSASAELVSFLESDDSPYQLDNLPNEFREVFEAAKKLAYRPV